MSDNSRLTKNTIMLYIRMIAVMAISLYTSRIVLKNLGIDDFGLYEVVGSVASMFLFLNTAMNSSTQRYLTIAIGKGDTKELHKIFNVSCVIHTIIGLLIVLICEVIGIWFIQSKMVIPEGRESAVFWSFQLSMVAAFVTIISVPYNALLIAREKMDTFAYISIFDVLFKLFIAFIISITKFDRLIFYALLIALSQILIRFIYSIYCKRRFPECSFKFYKFDSLYKEMTVFASWGLLGHISYIINTSFQNMMLNFFFSPVVNAARGVTLRVSHAISGFSANFQTAVSPQITKAWAVDDKTRTYNLIFNSSRFSLYLIWLMTLPLLLCMSDVLNFWLVEVPDYTMSFLSIMLILSLIETGCNPLNMAIRANGKIKYPELFSGIIQILNLPLSYVALRLGYGPQSVFIVMIFCRILSQLVKIYYAHIYLKMSVLAYLQKVVLKPFMVLLLSMIIPLLLSNIVSLQFVLVRIGFNVSVCLISISLMVWFIGLSKDERTYFITVIKNRIK